jgi:alpha-acetolactate decarboxylase
MSPQLTQVLNQARQLSVHDQLELVRQLSVASEEPADTMNEISDDRPEAALEYIDGVLVVKSQGVKLLGDLVAEMRENRMWEIVG